MANHTLAQNLTRLNKAREDIADAIVARGGSATHIDGLESMPTSIQAIPNQYAQADNGKVVINGALVSQTSTTATTNGTIDTTTNNEVVVAVQNTYVAGDENKVVHNGELTAQTSDTTTENGVVDTTLISSLTVNVSGGTDTPKQTMPKTSLNGRATFTHNWTTKTWTGNKPTLARGIWTDGINVYYSIGTTHYVLNKTTMTWDTKTWIGLTDFDGDDIWTDGTDLYCSIGTTHYVLNKTTMTWDTKTWIGLTNFNGNDIWTDGIDIYCEYSSRYMLDKATSTWTVVANDSTNARNIWTDGTDIYAGASYQFDKVNKRWASKTWSGTPSWFTGESIWTDGDNIYCSVNGGSSSRGTVMLVKGTNKWISTSWTGSLTYPQGNYIWTDGNDIYAIAGDPVSHYVLDKSVSPTILTTSCKPKFTT